MLAQGSPRRQGVRAASCPSCRESQDVAQKKLDFVTMSLEANCPLADGVDVDVVVLAMGSFVRGADGTRQGSKSYTWGELSFGG